MVPLVTLHSTRRARKEGQSQLRPLRLLPCTVAGPTQRRTLESSSVGCGCPRSALPLPPCQATDERALPVLLGLRARTRTARTGAERAGTHARARRVSPRSQARKSSLGQECVAFTSMKSFPRMEPLPSAAEPTGSRCRRLRTCHASRPVLAHPESAAWRAQRKTWQASLSPTSEWPSAWLRCGGAPGKGRKGRTSRWGARRSLAARRWRFRGSATPAERWRWRPRAQCAELRSTSLQRCAAQVAGPSGAACVYVKGAGCHAIV